MTSYRMYFLASERIEGRQDFEADEDIAAIRIARVLHDACSDICQSFELWQGTRQIRAQHQQTDHFAELIEDHQRLTINTEELISQSDWRIARSRRLIETLDQIKPTGHRYHRQQQ